MMTLFNFLGIFFIFSPFFTDLQAKTTLSFGKDSTQREEAQAGIDESRLPQFELRENPMVARRDSLVALAKTFLGRPYVWGGTTPYGFDCSGFAWYLFRQFGYNMHRMSGDQATLGRWVKTEEAEPGDLVFYGYPYGNTYVYTHTAIVYNRDSKNNVNVIHSSFLGLAITGIHFDPNYTCRLIGIKRVIE
ncbi:MAG: NlpC/P60 family protein [Bacteroidetes bacterium]|nr:MAG: NlpC/P60 family protein [Bacteroidota bacterium]